MNIIKKQYFYSGKSDTTVLPGVVLKADELVTKLGS